jgi:MGT family glycosyltransferase
MSTGKTIAFFPEACYGPALNSVGIAQACEKIGHKAVFLTDPGLSGVYSGYGFDEYPVNMSEPMPPDEMAKYWTDFIDGHIPNFALSPYDQIDNYVKECWENIVNTSVWAEKELPGILAEIQPDVICVDNVVMFPACKNYGVPWVRIVSCSENEVTDPAIPPHLSGCGENDHEAHKKYRDKFNEMIAPIHAGFNEFLHECGIAPYPIGQFCEASPYLNMLLYPEPVKFNRRNPLDPERFRYLEGCVRKDADFDIPVFEKNNDGPVVYLSFGSLGCGDTGLLNRLIDELGKTRYRALVNVGDYMDAYSDLPGNVQVSNWFPQPTLISQVDMVIHHGGNNTFTECLYFGKPAIIMPYVWDGHDNATRVAETGHGFKMHRSNWKPEELLANIDACLTDPAIQAKMASTAEHMQKFNGPERAATMLDQLVKGHANAA